LILTPTRELAIQISQELNSLKGTKKLKILPIYGGQSIDLQVSRLKSGIDIIVGTPGRILDHINRKTIDLSLISDMVLDEADEMLNMGFIDDVEEILKHTNDTKRLLMFSATIPTQIVSIAKKHMKNYEIIKTKKDDTTSNLTQQIYFEVNYEDKFQALCRIIDMQKEFYALVFCKTKIETDELANKLQDAGYNALALHGDMTQKSREIVLNKFKRKSAQILIATDVAARGIDIENLTHVINYSIPENVESYIHRIGRTGRAGKSGIAITFVTPNEYNRLIYMLKTAKLNIKNKVYLLLKKL
jgi:ATP-dependent RNA helicase DeaD